jgi:hypothetical protein
MHGHMNVKSEWSITSTPSGKSVCMSDSPRICEHTATELRHCSEYPKGLNFVSTRILGQVLSKSELEATTFLKM